MKKLLTYILGALCTLLISEQGMAQGYLKLNLPAAAVGVVNLQFESAISAHSTMSVDALYSPWQSINGTHLHFGIFTAEYRYFFKQSFRGWFLSANAGLTGFDISKPTIFKNGELISFRNSGYSKGFGVCAGLGVGWEHQFRERWIVDIFLGIDLVHSWYNGYNKYGEIEMNPHGHEHYDIPDPFNASIEIRPVKFGISVGYRLFKKKATRE